MREIEPIESLERAAALLHPMRTQILARAVEPVSAVELARELGETPQKLNYHLRALEKAGLLERVREEKKRNLTKAYYQARARRLWLSPRLVAEGARTRDRLSLENLLGLAQEVERDVVKLMDRADAATVASLGVRAELRFRDAEARRAFLEDYVAVLDQLVRKHGASDGDAKERFAAILAVYPKQTEA